MIEDILKFIFLIIVVASALVLFAYGCARLSEYEDNRKSQKECYEIYATDNVILKKCEKYFDKEVK